MTAIQVKVEENSFDKQFPNLKRNCVVAPSSDYEWVHIEDIIKFCLDKQKVREAIKPYLLANKDDNKIRNILKNICWDLGFEEKELGL